MMCHCPTLNEEFFTTAVDISLQSFQIILNLL